MPAARKTRRLLVLGVLVGVVGLAAAVWPRGARLEWYTSLSFTLGSSTVQLRALVPAGWQAEIPVYVAAASDDSVEPNSMVVRVRRAARLRWLPAWLRRAMTGPGEPAAALDLVYRSETRSNGQETVRKDYPALGIGRAERHLPGGSYVAYTREQPDAFEATYRQICESFRVVR